MIYLLSISVLDIIGIFFNIRMVLSCLNWNKEKNAHLENYRIITTCQFVYQVTILSLNTVEVWKGLDVQHEESCSVLNVLSISLSVFLVCNLTALSVVHFQPAALRQNRKEQFAEIVVSAVVPATLAFGFVISIILSWFICSSYSTRDFIFSKVFTNHLWPLAILAVLVACTACFYWSPDTTTTTEDSTTTYQLETCLKENTKTILFLVMLFCFGVIIFRYCDRSLVDTKLMFAKFVCLLTMNFAVGIVLPVTFKDFIESSYQGYNETELTVVVSP